MPRARYIKPSFFTNDDLGVLKPAARLLFAGLWCLADREGRLEDRPKQIKVHILPYDNVNVDGLLNDLAGAGFILRYAVDAARFIQIRNFTKHQQPHYKEIASVIPAPEGHTDSLYVGGPIPKATAERVFARDGRRCVECGATEQLSIDHIVPQLMGGTHDETNLRVLCKACNSRKGHRELESTSGQGRPNNEASLPSDNGELITDNGVDGEPEAAAAGTTMLALLTALYEKRWPGRFNETIRADLLEWAGKIPRRDIVGYAFAERDRAGGDWRYVQRILQRLEGNGWVMDEPPTNGTAAIANANLMAKREREHAEKAK